MKLALKTLAKELDPMSVTGNVSDLQMDELIQHYSIVSAGAIVIGAEIKPEGAKLEIRGLSAILSETACSQYGQATAVGLIREMLTICRVL